MGLGPLNPGCSCCGITTCSGCCTGGLPTQIDVTVPGGFTNAGCSGCTGIAGTYTISRASYTHFPCDGSSSTVITINDCGYLHNDGNQCAIAGVNVQFLILAWMVYGGSGCYWHVVLRLYGLAANEICQEWVYESTPDADGFDCEIGATLNYVGTTGFYFNGSPSGNICANPPATITVQAS